MKKNIFIILIQFAIFISKAQSFDNIAYFTIMVNNEVSTNNFYYYSGPDALIKDKFCLIDHTFGNVNELVIKGFDFCYSDVAADNLLVDASFFYYITDETNTIQYIQTTRIALDHSLISSPVGPNPISDDYVYKDTKTTNVDLLSGLPLGNYNLHFWFEAHRLMPGWPPGNSIWVDSNENPYIAHFTKTTVTVNKNVLNNEVLISVKDNIISASFKGNAQIDIFKLTGEKVCSVNTKNYFNKHVEKGIYIFKINNKVFKICV